MKLPPAAANASKLLRLSVLEAPQPHASPKVIVPKHNSDTRSPLLPSSLYLTASSFAHTKGDAIIPGHGNRDAVQWDSICLYEKTGFAAQVYSFIQFEPWLVHLFDRYTRDTTQRRLRRYRTRGRRASVHQRGDAPTGGKAHDK